MMMFVKELRHDFQIENYLLDELRRHYNPMHGTITVVLKEDRKQEKCAKCMEIQVDHSGGIYQFTMSVLNGE